MNYFKNRKKCNQQNKGLRFTEILGLLIAIIGAIIIVQILPIKIWMFILGLLLLILGITLFRLI